MCKGFTVDKKERQKAASKRWYEKNKEKIALERKGTRNLEHKSYYEKRKAKLGLATINALAKVYRDAHPEQIKRTLYRYRKKYPERKLLYSARARAKKCGFDFGIDISDIVIPEICPLLKIPLEMLGQCDNSPSIDRIDNSKGYVKGNIWVISFKANRMKNTASIEELLTFSKEIIKHYGQ
jgi:hypothetical protein